MDDLSILLEPPYIWVVLAVVAVIIFFVARRFSPKGKATAAIRNTTSKAKYDAAVSAARKVGIDDDTIEKETEKLKDSVLSKIESSKSASAQKRLCQFAEQLKIDQGLIDDAIATCKENCLDEIRSADDAESLHSAVAKAHEFDIPKSQINDAEKRAMSTIASNLVAELENSQDKMELEQLAADAIQFGADKSVVNKVLRKKKRQLGVLGTIFGTAATLGTAAIVNKMVKKSNETWAEETTDK